MKRVVNLGGIFIKSNKRPESRNHDYGKFGWIMDPDGNRAELWEPPKE